MASIRQIRANKLNSLKSTGPKSPSGKLVASRNSLRHGLRSEAFVYPEQEAAEINRRCAELHSSLKPDGAYENWVTEEVTAPEMIRLERGLQRERHLRGQIATRAKEGLWDDDCEAAAEDLGARLPRAPGRVSKKLRQTKHGAIWLLERWEGLAEVIEEGGAWTARQEKLALDLLGVPAELREGCRTPIDPVEGRTSSEWRLELALGQIAGLRWRIEGPLEELDARDRAAAEMGVGSDYCPELKLVLRYQSMSVRRIMWAKRQYRSINGGVGGDDSGPEYFSTPRDREAWWGPHDLPRSEWSAPNPAPPVDVTGGPIDPPPAAAADAPAADAPAPSASSAPAGFAFFDQGPASHLMGGDEAAEALRAWQSGRRE